MKALASIAMWLAIGAIGVAFFFFATQTTQNQHGFQLDCFKLGGHIGWTGTCDR